MSNPTTFSVDGTAGTAPAGNRRVASSQRNVDELFLAGIRIDAGTSVDVGGIGADIDKPKASGASGQKIKIKGFKNATIKITITAWKRSQIDAIVDLLKQHVRPLSTGGASPKDPSPIPIGHWKTDIWGIQNIIIETIDGPSLTQQQKYGLRIDASEFRPPAARAYGIGYGGKKQQLSMNLSFLAQQQQINNLIVERALAYANNQRISAAQQQHATQLGTFNPPPSMWNIAP